MVDEITRVEKVRMLFFMEYKLVQDEIRLDLVKNDEMYNLSILGHNDVVKIFQKQAKEWSYKMEKQTPRIMPERNRKTVVTESIKEAVNEQ